MKKMIWTKRSSLSESQILFFFFLTLLLWKRWHKKQIYHKKKRKKKNMMCSLLGEITGLHYMLGPMILGLAVPDGWPLGSAIIDKLESFVSLILLPTCYVLSCGRRMKKKNANSIFFFSFTFFSLSFLFKFYV